MTLPAELSLQAPSSEGADEPNSRYRVAEKISEGPYSAVYRAVDTETGADVVLKYFEPDKRAVYLRELSAGFGLEGERLVHCLDTFFAAGGRGCIVYSYIPDGTLEMLLAQRDRFDTCQVKRCLQDLLTALIGLHDSGRIHCDLKPANVFVDLSNGDRFVLGDLGAVCFIREARSGRHTAGSPAYMAPERCYDRFMYNSDLYSLGIVGFELLTGERPFAGSAAEVARAHLSRAPDFTRIDDEPLRSFLERLLEKDPQRRMPSARAALHVLENLQRGGAQSGATPASTDTADIADIAAAAQPLGAALFQRVQQLDLVQRPDSLLIGGTAPQAVLCHASHAEQIDFVSGQTQRMLLHDAPLQQVNNAVIAYSSAGRVLWHDLDSGGGGGEIKAGCRDLLSFFSAGDGLLWSTSRGWHFFDAHRQAEVVVRYNNYLQPPLGCVLGDAYFLTACGPTGQRLTLYRRDATAARAWELDGPVLALTADGNEALALTLAASGDASYSLWRIDADSVPGLPAERQALSARVRCWQQAQGFLYWLDYRGGLHYCGTDGVCHDVGALPGDTASFAIAPDHRHLVTLAAGDNQISLWKNRALD